MIDYKFGVTLKRIEEHQLDKLREWRNNTLIRDYCRQVGLLSDHDQLQWFKKQNTDPTMRMFVIHVENRGPVGVCGLTSIDHLHRRAEFSCYISAGNQRLGFASAALKTLFEFGFRELNLNLIFGESFEFNGAIDLFKKIGMKEDGRRRQYYYKLGNFIDAVMLSILKDEFYAVDQTKSQ